MIRMGTLSTRLKPYLLRKIPLFMAMGCIGITTEVFFTAIYDLLTSAVPIGLSLKGVSSIWMFPIYGSIAFFFPPLMKRLSHWKAWQRALVYGLGILVFEYLSGGALQLLTGSCPWEYKTGYHVQGLIRLDYYPLWVIFAAGVERIVTRLERFESI